MPLFLASQTRLDMVAKRKHALCILSSLTKHVLFKGSPHAGVKEFS